MDDSDIDDDVQIAIEYNIPQTSKRVDFIIVGSNGEGKDNIVIVELKQWSKAEVVDDDADLEKDLETSEVVVVE